MLRVKRKYSILAGTTSEARIKPSLIPVCTYGARTYPRYAHCMRECANTFAPPCKSLEIFKTR
ncbi:hypothetical protein BABINDRAFT_160230 [Babjeviella inositovora NRRL Y-12698]|uniref:Uncharacterized protein n=1 Tax=Babjeviella inositovora NRRL Y-12698 TaxID=984486 RepID=A0A1E3QY69_9ASCO|nr:uncharacterized protein BABINDRAFT_160230 [Babjeviella inositovora NRRL Y-12698]ODQ82017.1 hypothetical protein BABINDRAFT_160230 [Babjeviella inositovora NRRL Y-12698]